MAFGITKDRDEASPLPQRGAGASAEASVIGHGMILDGDCETAGALRIDGHVKGSVRAGQLTVGPQGRVDGDVVGSDQNAGSAFQIDGHVGGAVRAPRVEIGREGAVGDGMRVTEGVVRGRVTGAIETEQRLVIEDTAVVEGDITARRLGLKEGSRVAGTVQVGDRASAPDGSASPASRSAGHRKTGKPSGDDGAKQESASGPTETAPAPAEGDRDRAAAGKKDGGA